MVGVRSKSELEIRRRAIPVRKRSSTYVYIIRAFGMRQALRRDENSETTRKRREGVAIPFIRLVGVLLVSAPASALDCAWDRGASSCFAPPTSPCARRAALAMADHHADVVVCASWMRVGDGACRPESPRPRCATAILGAHEQGDGPNGTRIAVCFPTGADPSALYGYGSGAAGLARMTGYLDTRCPSSSSWFAPAPDRPRCTTPWSAFLRLTGYSGDALDVAEECNARCGRSQSAAQCSRGGAGPDVPPTPQLRGGRPPPPTPTPPPRPPRPPPTTTTTTATTKTKTKTPEPAPEPAPVPLPRPVSIAPPCFATLEERCAPKFGKCDRYGGRVLRCCSPDHECVRKNVFYAQCRPRGRSAPPGPLWSGETLACDPVDARRADGETRATITNTITRKF